MHHQRRMHERRDRQRIPGRRIAAHHAGTRACCKKAAAGIRVVPSKSTALRRCRAISAKLRSRAGAAGERRRNGAGAAGSCVERLVRGAMNRIDVRPLAHAPGSTGWRGRATSPCSEDPAGAQDRAAHQDCRSTAAHPALLVSADSKSATAVESQQGAPRRRPRRARPVESASQGPPRRSSPRRWRGRNHAGSSATHACRISTLRASESN